MSPIISLVAALLVVCACADGDHVWQTFNCDHTYCVDPMWIKGQPCLFCPNGNTCRAPNGVVLEADRDYDIAGMKCKCRPTTAPNWDIARCDTDILT